MPYLYVSTANIATVAPFLGSYVVQDILHPPYGIPDYTMIYAYVYYIHCIRKLL